MSTLKVDTLDTRTGSGNITVSRPLSGSGASLTNLPAANLTGTIAAISGVNLTALNATQLTSGTVPDARFPATLPAASGVNLTALNATQLTSGTLPMARLSGTLPALNGSALTNLPSHSGNVAFPASQSASSNANTLDDYEEGTFTLALASHTATGSGQSYSSNTGTYTKIGRLVLCAGYFDPSSSGDLDTGHNTKLTGFPFTSQTHGHSRYSLTINDPGVMSKGTDASVQAYLPGGATYAYMHKSNVTTGVSPLTIGELNNGSFGYTVVYNT